MKVWRTILIFMMVLVLAWSLTACRQDDERNEQTPPEAETGEEIMLSDALVELSIWQQEDAVAEEIVTYEGAWPQRSVTFAVHDPEVAFKLRLQDEIDLGTAELEEAVAVTGAKVRISEGEDSQSFLVTLTEIQDRAEIKLGDLEPFRLRTRQDHLMFVLNQSELRVPYALLIHGESDGRSHVFVSEIEDAIVLRFTEPMRPVEHPGTEWLSETQLKVDIAETAGTLPLDKFYSEDGNFVARKYHSLVVHQIPSRSWFDAASGGSVGWSGRDAYYDALLFSPDGSKYAGLVQISEDTDGAGGHYGIVIEQRGQSPIVLDHTIHYRLNSGYLPVEWLDQQTLLYLSGFQVWAFDVESGLARQLTIDDEHQAVAFQYDQRSGRLFVLTQSSISRDGREYWQGGMSIYRSDLELAERIETISDPWPSTENNILPLKISVQSSGYYLTTYREGRIVTQYFANGEETEAPGQLIGTTDQGAYLLETSEGDEVMRVLWWPRGGSAVPVEPLADSSYIMFGGDLFARRAGVADTYYGYNPGRDEWIEWSPNAGRDSWIPHQRTAYYRVTD